MTPAPLAYLESVRRLPCEGEHLLAVLAEPLCGGSELGVVIVVGGPQYRAGSHRQFVQLARTLAAAGTPTLRFDVRGMGDSTGAPRDFQAIGTDIAAAIDALQVQVPTVRQVVLWGLCDGASAALMYWHASVDARLAGLCLANPWLRSDVSEARTRLKHYYLQRLRQPDFWQKLLRGGLGLGAVAELARKMGASARREVVAPAGLNFRQQMAGSWLRFPGPILLLLSGRDFTAKEFLDGVQHDTHWRGALQRTGLTRLDRPDADHSFSAPGDHMAVAEAVAAWLQTHFGVRPAAPADDVRP